MSNLGYSEFILDASEQSTKHADDLNKFRYRQNLIQSHVAKNGLVKLKSHTFGMESYYYDDKTKTIYKVNNVREWFNDDVRFEIVPDTETILRINSLA
jgi:hypothetical protein